MLYTLNTYNSQKKFTNWVRTGRDANVPGATAAGLEQYRRLFRNNIDNSLTQAYPICAEVLEKEEWTEMIDDFFENHDAQTPHIWKLPYEFYQFALENNYSKKYNYPYLNDLLFLEWIEIEVYTMPDEFPELYSKTGDKLKMLIEVNSEYRLTKLEYPVHLRSAKESLNYKGEYFLLTYREPETGDVKFINLDPLHVYFFEQVANERKTGVQIINELNAQNIEINEDKLLNNLLAFVDTMFAEKVFMGFSKNYHN